VGLQIPGSEGADRDANTIGGKGLITWRKG